MSLSQSPFHRTVSNRPKVLKDEDYIEITSAKGGIHEEHAVMIALKPEKDPVTSKT